MHSGETEVRILMDLSVVIRYIQQQSSHYSDIASTASSGLVRIRSEQTPEVRHRGQRGRPPFVISLDQLEALIELGLSMRRIASVLGVSERTVRRRREMYGLPIGRDRYSLLLDHELDRLVSDIMQVRVYFVHAFYLDDSPRSRVLACLYARVLPRSFTSSVFLIPDADLDNCI